MAVAFNKILIPVDFSLNTETAVKKAIGLVGTDETVIDLLHVVRPGSGDAAPMVEGCAYDVAVALCRVLGGKALAAALAGAPRGAANA